MQTNNYRVKDLYLAAYLYGEGLEMCGIEREGRVCWFTFVNKKRCEELAILYWKNQASSKIKNFTDAIRTLKDLIYSS